MISPSLVTKGDFDPSPYFEVLNLHLISGPRFHSRRMVGADAQTDVSLHPTAVGRDLRDARRRLADMFNDARMTAER